MKNIHVLPTENSSRLSYNKDGVLELHRLQWRKNTQHISITNDEEIKEGDWFIYKNEIIHRDKGKIDSMWVDADKNGKKIILTTDQDLIKDGVQGIDDEFLEWFVNNPSCEEVEVKKKGISDHMKRFAYYRYEIIIPQEEPKQEKDYTALLQPVGTKQTAVEFLENQYNSNGKLTPVDFYQAKEMEKKQIIDSFNEGWLQCNIYGLPEKSRKHFETAEQYYSETFSK
jgi:hypothetical protein